MEEKNHNHRRKTRLRERFGTAVSEDFLSGQIARSKGGWVILKEQPSGIWSTVGGPVQTRESARKLSGPFHK